MFKTLTLVGASLLATSAFADMCYIVEDAYTPAAYRVVYHGGPDLVMNPMSLTGVSVTQIRHSDLTVSAFNAPISNLMLGFTESPRLHRGHARLGGHQNGAFIDMRVGGFWDRITIWHKFVTARGDFHTHIAGDVHPCLSHEFPSYDHPGKYPEKMPGQQVPGQQVPGQQIPEQLPPGQQVPGQVPEQLPEHQSPSQPMPGYEPNY